MEGETKMETSQWFLATSTISGMVYLATCSRQPFATSLTISGSMVAGDSFALIRATMTKSENMYHSLPEKGELFLSLCITLLFL
jgi:hypothetical protein